MDTTVEIMEPKTHADQIADLRALIERQKQELAELTEINAKATKLLTELIRKKPTDK